MIDIDVEIEKCEKKKKVALLALDRIKKNEAHPNYEQTVDAETRLANVEKVRTHVLSDVPVMLTTSHVAETTRVGNREPRGHEGNFCKTQIGVTSCCDLQRLVCTIIPRSSDAYLSTRPYQYYSLCM